MHRIAAATQGLANMQQKVKNREESLITLRNERHQQEEERNKAEEEQERLEQERLTIKKDTGASEKLKIKQEISYKKM